ncbi:hypothetical protein DF274_07495, partial [Listeria monocytogenes]
NIQNHLFTVYTKKEGNKSTKNIFWQILKIFFSFYSKSEQVLASPDLRSSFCYLFETSVIYKFAKNWREEKNIIHLFLSSL